MKSETIILSEGHTQIQQTMKNIQVRAFGETGQVRLVLATESHQATAPHSGTGQSATTLAIDMDQATAMRLLLDLHTLQNSMGWPLAIEVGKQDGFQTQTYATLRGSSDEPRKR